ncbi:MAG: hypothetical protein K8R92_12100 [Planctomycetes bacterium]|nr:hypothetical protein [Planctomycetota bacterium]
MPKTESLAPLEMDPQNKIMIMSPYGAPEGPGMDLADLFVAAWRSRVLLIVSWIVLTVAIYAVLVLLGKTTVSTVIRSGQLSDAIQTQDQIRNQITQLIFPLQMQSLAKEKQHPVAASVKVDLPRNSDLLEVSITSSSLSEDELNDLLEQVTQAWSRTQSVKITNNVQLTRDHITLLENEIVSINNYVNSLNTKTDPMQQTEADRMRMRIDSQKQTIFSLNNSITTFEQPLIRKPFETLESNLAVGIRGAGLCVLLGAALACCVAYFGSVVRVARSRLRNS